MTPPDRPVILAAGFESIRQEVAPGTGAPPGRRGQSDHGIPEVHDRRKGFRESLMRQDPEGYALSGEALAAMQPVDTSRIEWRLLVTGD